MNVAVALLVGAAIVPLVAIDVRRKFRKSQRSQQPFVGMLLPDDRSPFDVKSVPVLERRISTPGPVDVRHGVWHHPSGQTYWVGLDLATVDDLCSEHGTASYAADDQSSFGTIGEVSE